MSDRIKKNPKKPTSKSQRSSSEVSESEHQVGIITEHFDSKLDLIVENIQSFRNEFKSNLADFRADVDAHFETVEASQH